MRTLDLRDNGYSNDTIYFLTVDHDLVHISDLTADDEVVLKILTNGILFGSIEEWEEDILIESVNFINAMKGAKYAN